MRTPAKLAVLTSLYLAQGLPYGFFTVALPVIMREQKQSLGLIGASAVLALPWGLKFLWAPVVDRWGNSPLGRRRGWILPLQALTVLSALALALSQEGAQAAGAGAAASVAALALGLLVMNFLAATQDVATDGLAVDVLELEERGHGNGIQVGAYRVGMVIGGFGLVRVFARDGWHATFLAMAALLALTTVPSLFFDEKRHARRDGGAAVEGAPVTLAAAVAFVKRRGVPLWIALVLVYKLGDALVGPMTKTLVSDAGYSIDEIGSLFALWGSGFGLAGALAGGWLAKKRRLLALVVGGLLHTALLFAWAYPGFVAAGASARDTVMVLVVIEHFTGGMATVALFTAMMDVCDPRQGGTEYTVQACAVVGVQLVGSFFSGISAQHLGYGAHFVLVGAVSLAGVVAMAAGFARHPVWSAAGASDTDIGPERR